MLRRCESPSIAFVGDRQCCFQFNCMTKVLRVRHSHHLVIRLLLSCKLLCNPLHVVESCQHVAALHIAVRLSTPLQARRTIHGPSESPCPLPSLPGGFTSILQQYFSILSSAFVASCFTHIQKLQLQYSKVALSLRCKLSGCWSCMEDAAVSRGTHSRRGCIE